MSLKKSLFNQKGYSKHKNEGMSLLANSLTSLADGEIDKITLANGDNKIKLTITEKEADTELFDMEREIFRNSLKGNTGVLPYYISEYFGNKEVPRYLTKGEAAYVMTVNPDIELLGVKAGKGGSTIISKEPISLENNESYNKYKNFMTTKASDTPIIDKTLSLFEEFTGKNYDETLIEESGKLYNKVMEDLKKQREEESNTEDEEREVAISADMADAYLEGNYEEDDDEIDDADAAAESIVSELDESEVDEDIDYDSEVLEDISEVSKDNLAEEEEASTYEEEVLNSLDEEDIEE